MSALSLGVLGPPGAPSVASWGLLGPPGPSWASWGVLGPPGKCNTLHAKTCFLKVRSRGGAGGKHGNQANHGHTREFKDREVRGHGVWGLRVTVKAGCVSDVWWTLINNH